MTHAPSASKPLSELLPKKVSTLFFLVRPQGAYKVGRRWGIFDTLGVRTIDDLSFADDTGAKTIVAFTAEPPHGGDSKVIGIPAQIAFERIFFHIQEVSSVILNPRQQVVCSAREQEGAQFSLPEGFDEEVVLSRNELPELIGAYALPAKKGDDQLARAERAFKANSLFEAFTLARRVRQGGGADAQRAWFIELLSLSFMGLPDDALSLYEEYPLRGASEPEAQLVAARFRILLKQWNEARTILHGLTFNESLGAIASCELARSYLATAEFDRAIDIASNAIQRDPQYTDAYLVRGIAHRGLAYGAGDEEGLNDALRDFEKVAQQGGYNAPEASFHAGTIFGRLGALEEAEVALRQSLFQRDRYASRDALVRVLCANHRAVVAQQELDLLCALVPSVTQDLRREVERHLVEEGTTEATKDSLSANTQRAGEVAQATSTLQAWKVPVSSTMYDFAVLDDFINRFAPGGEFIPSQRCEALRSVGALEFGRVVAFHLGALLVQAGLASWDDHDLEKVALISKRGGRIPLESFVHERLILGASGDNLSALESLVSEVSYLSRPTVTTDEPLWQEATGEEIGQCEVLAEKGRHYLLALGAELHDSLRDLDEIDRVIEGAFEPGGVVQEVAKPILGEAVDEFIIGIGLYVGGLVSKVLPSQWFSHELPEGISLVAEGIGRIFPVARMQRRVYLSSAAETTATLSSFAFGVAAAVISDRVKKGVYTDRPHVMTALRELLPRVAEFSEGELEGVVDVLFENSRRSS
jgi:tetratricopeptide (TPR) repeat protein